MTQKQQIISSFPFPIGYVYQTLSVESLKTKDNMETRETLMWHILRGANALLKLVSIIAMCDYLQNRKQYSDEDLNSKILSYIKCAGEENGHNMLSALVGNVAINKSLYNIPEIAKLQIRCLTEPDNIYKQRNWLDLMFLFVELKENLLPGKIYQFSPPPMNILQKHLLLLEEAYVYCDFLSKYGVYVLVSKDERKTRGFLCRGTKSKAIGIRGVSNEKWHNYKGKPFLSHKQKENLSLFPFVVPFVKQIGDKKSFADLLFFETTTSRTLTYFSYRHLSLINYKECSSNALFFLQKELEWLHDNSNQHPNDTSLKKVQEKKNIKNEEELLYPEFCKNILSKRYACNNEHPQNFENTFAVVWENLPETSDFIVYKILSLAAIAQEFIDDIMVSYVFSVSKEIIEQAKYTINIFLQYNEQQYTLSHNVYRKYIMKQLSGYDLKLYNDKIANYYEKVRGDSEASLLYLSYHCFNADKLEKLKSLALNKILCQRKIKKFKSNELVLNDMHLAMQKCLEHADWKDLFHLSSEYCNVVIKSLKGVTHTFSYAENSDYATAIKMAKDVGDATQVFKVLLVILLFSIENEDLEASELIFSALEKVPDNEVNYVASGLESFVVYVLQKIAKTKLLPIHTIIRKHGLRGAQAVSHLFEIQSQVDFAQNQLKIFLSSIIQTSVQIESNEEKYEIIAEVIPVLCSTEFSSNAEEVWKWLTELLNSIEEVFYKISCYIFLAKTISKEKKLTYLSEKIKELEVMIKVEEDFVILAKYAELLNQFDDLDQAKYQLEKVFIKINQESKQEQCNSYLSILPIIEEIGNFDNMRIYWKRIFSLCKKDPINDTHEKLLQQVCIYFAKINKWEHIFMTLPQIQLLKLPLREGLFLQFSLYLKEIFDNTAYPHWEILLEQTKFLRKSKKRLRILENIADGLFRLQILASNTIWKKYLAVCDLLKDVGHDEDKNKALAYLACKMAENSYVKNAETIISRLSSPLFRSKPLACLALYHLRHNNLSKSIKLEQDISDTKERYRLFIAMSNSKELAFHKKIIPLITSDIQNESYDLNSLVIILENLLIPSEIETSKNTWHEVFSWIHHLNETSKIALSKKCIMKLEKIPHYDSTKFLWTYLYQAINSIESGSKKLPLYVNIASLFIQWGQLQEANKHLETSLDILSQINLQTALDSLVNIANLYREMGEEIKYTNILTKIDNMLWQEKLPPNKIYPFIISLFEKNCYDLGQSVLEKAVLKHVKLKDELPKISTLIRIIDTSIDIELPNLARNLFFQTLLHIENATDNYLEFLQLLQKMRSKNNVIDLWEQAEAIVLNFSSVISQEKYLEALSIILIEIEDYKQTKEMWQKLLQDAMYIGQDTNVIKCICTVGMSMLKVAPWEDFEKTFNYALHKWRSLNPEYEKLKIISLVARTVLGATDLSITNNDFWQELKKTPKNWNEDDKNSAFSHLIKALADNANSGTKRIFFSQAEELAERISKSQQSCEMYIYIAKALYRYEMKEEAKHTLEKATSMGEKLGKFYHNNIIPNIISIYLENNELELINQKIELILDPNQCIDSLFQLVHRYAKNKETEKVQATIKIIMKKAEILSKIYGDYFKIHLQLVAFLEEYNLQKEKNITEKAFFSWNEIQEASYQQESIDFATSIMSLKSKEWLMLIKNANTITEEAYKVLALQKIALRLIELKKYTLVDSILAEISDEDITKQKILKAYVKELGKSKQLPKAISLINKSKEEQKMTLIYFLAQGINNDKYALSRLLVDFPGNFQMNAYLISEILIIESENNSAFFQTSLEEILPMWGIKL